MTKASLLVRYQKLQALKTYHITVIESMMNKKHSISKNESVFLRGFNF